MSLLLAQSGHPDTLSQCPLSGVKRTLLNHTMRQRLLVVGCLARAPSKECGRCLLTKLGLAQFTARLFWRFAGDWWLVFTPCRRMRLRLAIRDQFARTHNS